MNDFSKFRSALGGFHRGDVANYIEALCAEHRSTLKEAQAEKDAALAQLDIALQELEAEKARVRELTADRPEPEEPQDYHAMELEAYRRAEAMERAASDRAEKVRTDLQALLDDTANQYTAAGEEITRLTQQLTDTAEKLRTALDGLTGANADTAEKIGKLKQA